MGGKGWIKLYRQLQDNPMWYSEKFTRGQAWVDILLSVNHEDKEIMFNGKPVTVKRGQMITSVRKLADRWKWSKDKTSKFLRTLIRTGNIHTESDTHRTLITVIKWGSFQGRADTNQDTNQDTLQDTLSPQTRRKEDKEEKKGRSPMFAVVLNDDESNIAEYDSDRENHPFADGWRIDENGRWIKV